MNTSGGKRHRPTDSSGIFFVESRKAELDGQGNLPVRQIVSDKGKRKRLTFRDDTRSRGIERNQAYRSESADFRSGEKLRSGKIIGKKRAFGICPERFRGIFLQCRGRKLACGNFDAARPERFAVDYLKFRGKVMQFRRERPSSDPSSAFIEDHSLRTPCDCQIDALTGFDGRVPVYEINLGPFRVRSRA